jgi:hypothetical protein
MMPGIHKCKAVFMYTRNLPIDKKGFPMKLSRSIWLGAFHTIKWHCFTGIANQFQVSILVEFIATKPISFSFIKDKT